MMAQFVMEGVGTKYIAIVAELKQVGVHRFSDKKLRINKILQSVAITYVVGVIGINFFRALSQIFSTRSYKVIFKAVNKLDYRCCVAPSAPVTGSQVPNWIIEMSNKDCKYSARGRKGTTEGIKGGSPSCGKLWVGRFIHFFGKQNHPSKRKLN